MSEQYALLGFTDILILPSSDSYRPIVSSRMAGSGQTYPKLLPAVELFNPPPISSRLNMAYPARTGVGYRVNKPDGTYEYQYFEPISMEPHEIPVVVQREGETLNTGHGAVSDTGHADPLLEGGASSLGFSRTQREIAHPTGTPKFCGNSGAACETFGLNRGNDFIYAPARLSATILRGKPLRNKYSIHTYRPLIHTSGFEELCASQSQTPIQSESQSNQSETVVHITILPIFYSTYKPNPYLFLTLLAIGLRIALSRPYSYPGPNYF